VMKIIAQSRSVVTHEYALEYVFEDSDERYEFPCDKEGNVNIDAINSEAYWNLMKCQSGEFLVCEPWLITYEVRHVAHAIGQCDCGAEVILDSAINVCPSCGKEYDISGTELYQYREAV